MAGQPFKSIAGCSDAQKMPFKHLISALAFGISRWQEPETSNH
jgi:hypothetical protein